MYLFAKHLRILGHVAAAGSLALLLVGAMWQNAASQPLSTQAQRADPSRWEKDIATFEAWDRKNSPPRDAILFVGSSSIVGWSTATAFPDWPAINRGFGGSHISESTAFFERIIAPYKPRAIVLYAGDNDVASGLSAEQVAADFAAFAERVRGSFRETPILFLSIKPSRARWEHWPAMQVANRRIAEYCETHARLRFVDVAKTLLDDKGDPRSELFLADQLHLNATGYAAWASVLRPQLAELFKDQAGGKPK